MNKLSWILAILLLFLSSLASVQSQDETTTLTQIGRGAVQSAEWHPDGDYILVSTVTGAWLYTPELEDLAHIPDAQLATLSPDGRYIAGVDSNSTIRVWDANTLEPLDFLDDWQFRSVNALSWSFDGRYLAASVKGNSEIIYVWEMRSTPDVVFAHRDSVDTLLWSPQEHHLAMLQFRYRRAFYL